MGIARSSPEQPQQQQPEYAVQKDPSSSSFEATGHNTETQEEANSLGYVKLAEHEPAAAVPFPNEEDEEEEEAKQCDDDDDVSLLLRRGSIPPIPPPADDEEEEEDRSCAN